MSLRVIASSKPPPAELETFEEERPLESQNHVRCHLEGVPCEIPVWDRRHLRSGDWVSGPAIIQDSFSTLMVDRGWKAVTGSMGSQYLTRNPLRTDLQVPSERLQEEAPFQLELFTHRFFSLVEEMGLMLQRTLLVHQCQGAARLFLCPSGCPRKIGRQRTSHPCASGGDGHLCQKGHGDHGPAAR